MRSNRLYYYVVIGIVFWILASSAGNASPITAATPSVVPAVDPQIAARAKEWFYRFQKGDIDRTQLNQAVNLQLSDSMVDDEAQKLRSFGKPIAFTFLRTYAIQGVAGYDFLWNFTNGQILEMIAFDNAGKIAGIDFQLFVRRQ